MIDLTFRPLSRADVQPNIRLWAWAAEIASAHFDRARIVVVEVPPGGTEAAAVEFVAAMFADNPTMLMSTSPIRYAVVVPADAWRERWRARRQWRRVMRLYPGGNI